MWPPELSTSRRDWRRSEERTIVRNVQADAEMASNAKKGLEQRAKFNRGGVKRAEQLAHRRDLDVTDVKSMHSYFARHVVDKDGKSHAWGSDDDPSAGYIARLFWGVTRERFGPTVMWPNSRRKPRHEDTDQFDTAHRDADTHQYIEEQVDGYPGSVSPRTVSSTTPGATSRSRRTRRRHHQSINIC